MLRDEVIVTARAGTNVVLNRSTFRHTGYIEDLQPPLWTSHGIRAPRIQVNKVILMPERLGPFSSRSSGVRDRRYALRYPFAADAEIIDMETGRQTQGVTSDISMGGCFICTSKPLSVNARARLKLSRKGQTLEALVAVRIVKPRVGMGVEFLDLELANQETLAGWIETLRRAR